MPGLKTHEQFIKEVFIKNEHIRKGDMTIVGTYKNRDTKIEFFLQVGLEHLGKNRLIGQIITTVLSYTL